MPSDQSLRRFLAAVRGWFAFYDHSQTIMEGGDSTDPDPLVRAADMDRAADDYELLAANYPLQPATDNEEDGCRWMAHELRRRAAWCPMKERWAPTKALWVQAWNEVLSFIQTPMDRTSSRLLHGRTEGPLLWYLEYIILIWSCAIAYSTFARRIVSVAWGAVRFALTWSFARNGLWEWGIKRTAVGYLLQWWRLLITGAILILLFAGIYGVFINGPGDISHGSFGPVRDAATGAFVYPDDAYLYWKQDWRNPLYLSLMTFVTLGYGDFQPAAGWLKLVTGVEGLLGVTLLALFTVAWGRKMVR